MLLIVFVLLDMCTSKIILHFQILLSKIKGILEINSKNEAFTNLHIFKQYRRYLKLLFNI